LRRPGSKSCRSGRKGLATRQGVSLRALRRLIRSVLVSEEKGTLGGGSESIAQKGREFNSSRPFVFIHP
jgi:hypothetical protein